MVRCTPACGGGCVVRCTPACGGGCVLRCTPACGGWLCPKVYSSMRWLVVW